MLFQMKKRNALEMIEYIGAAAGIIVIGVVVYKLFGAQIGAWVQAIIAAIGL